MGNTNDLSIRPAWGGSPATTFHSAAGDSVIRTARRSALAISSLGQAREVQADFQDDQNRLDQQQIKQRQESDMGIDHESW